MNIDIEWLISNRISNYELQIYFTPIFNCQLLIVWM